MIWLVWRRQRAALLFALGLAAFVAVVAGVGRFVAVGIGDGLGVLPCLRGVLTGLCATQIWNDYYLGVSAAVSLTVAAALGLPVVAGITAGAGLFGRELERGTHVFALSQSTSRLRWWATGMLVAGVPVAAAVALASAVAEIAVRPFGNVVGSSSPLSFVDFVTTGVLPAGYTLLSFGAAAAAGLVLRNALAAVAVGAAVHVLVLTVLGFGIRDHYLTPETAVAPIEATLEESNMPLPDDGLLLTSGYLDGAGQEIDPRRFATPECDQSYVACLQAVGAERLFVVFQPASRYWPFQAIESGIVLALVAGSLGVGLWGLRRRVH